MVFLACPGELFTIVVTQIIEGKYFGIRIHGRAWILEISMRFMWSCQKIICELQKSPCCFSKSVAPFRLTTWAFLSCSGYQIRINHHIELHCRVQVLNILLVFRILIALVWYLLHDSSNAAREAFIHILNRFVEFSTFASLKICRIREEHVYCSFPLCATMLLLPDHAKY